MTASAASGNHGRSPDDTLLAPLPEFSVDDLAEALAKQFGIRGKLARISGERDLNFHVSGADGRSYVFKISGESDAPDELAFQTAALAHLASADPALPVPRVVPGRDGSHVVPHEQNGRRCALRVLSYLPGEPALNCSIAPALRRSIGELAARLDLGLATFDHPGGDRAFIWDLAQMPALRDKIACLDTGARRTVAEQVYARFADTVLPRARLLRRQIIHNDLNQNNLLLRDGVISGMIDFGDMTRTYLVAEIAIAAAHLLYRQEDVLTAMAEVVDGYARILPLREEEVAVLPALIQARLLARELIVAWRRQANPDATTSYRDDVSRLGWAALARCDALAEGEARQRLAEAAGLG